ncbi:MAG: phasin family protein [Candidatus Methanoperedens sp.]|nr:phasin family protein [Candidatus Methanoperedens sp.]
MSEMSEMLRKMGLFGIGVISLTQEKLDEFTAEMIKKGEMNREEGKKFVREVWSEREKQVKEIEDKINQKIKEALDRSGVATKGDLEELKKKIEDLEKTVNTLTNR